MKTRFLPAAMLLAHSMTCASGDALQLVTKDDRTGYSIGYQVGGDFRRQQLEARPALLLKGIQDAVSGTPPLMTRGEMHQVLAALNRQLVAEQNRQKNRTASENLAKSRAFMRENASKKGIKTTASGLQYKVIRAGNGDRPGRQERVTVHYSGRLIDGSEFDSSRNRNEPASFNVDQVISGWTEALLMMREGARWQLFIPPQLAYGGRRTGRIPANSALVFDVELISVSSPRPDAQASDGRPGG